ncbi:MAG: outer membrane protein assembly factor BamD [Candidatus Omnitrophota bacterium]
MKLKLATFVLVLILACGSVAFAEESQRLYVSGVKAAKRGDLAYAFMFFRSLSENFPESRVAQEALFASAEYYFLIGAFTDARPAFIRFITEYPDSKARPFALLYLSKIAEAQGQEALAESLQKEIITSQQLVLLFRDFKKFQYLSPLNKNHRAVHFIDRIEFYIDGELFAQISY